MPASLRELRERRSSVTTTKKVTRAMELIAASRIVKAQQRAQSSAPYARELTRAVSAVATFSNVDHPLTTEAENPTRAAVLLITSDRGLAGAYSSSVIRQGEQLTQLLRENGKTAVPYLAGRKAAAFYKFRQRTGRGCVGGLLRGADLRPRPRDRGRADRGVPDPDRGGRGGRDPRRLHPVRLDADPEGRGHPAAAARGRRGRGAPADAELLPLYEFEPDAETVLDELLPLYVASRIQYCLLQGAASELASRQRAMKSATDNAQQLIERLTREANQARQAEITQEISEIVGGAAALADASTGSD